MKEEIHSKLKDLKKYAKLLESYQKYGKKELKKDLTLRGAVERYLQTALECILDIGQMIIAIKGFRKPEKYKEVILILGEEGILPKDFAKKFAPAAGFRNVLVHKYAEVDLDKLYKHLQEDLEDFDFFAKCIAEFAKKLDNPHL